METKSKCYISWHMICFSLLVIAVSFFTYGCGQNLSRSNAGEIISKSEGLPKTIFYYLPVGKVNEGSLTKFGSWNNSWNDHLRAWKVLQSMGYINVKELGKVRTGFLSSNTAEISLSDKGKSIFTHYQKHFYKMELCKKVMVDVTGISKRDNGAAIVEYSWKYDNIIPIANAVILNNSPLRGTNIGQLHKDEVWMRKYDNGWRISK